MPENLQALIAAIEADLVDPHDRLPLDLFEFVSRLTPLVNVDLLIQDDRARTLLTWRDDEFFGAGWHVPGGIVRYKERAADRIRAVAREELGADVASDPAPLGVFEGVSDRATRGHHIALLFRCRLLGPLDETKRSASDPPARWQWRWHDHCPPNLLQAQRDYARFF